jgi:hypothetical protein
VVCCGASNEDDSDALRLLVVPAYFVGVGIRPEHAPDPPVVDLAVNPARSLRAEATSIGAPVTRPSTTVARTPTAAGLRAGVPR